MSTPAGGAVASAWSVPGGSAGSPGPGWAAAAWGSSGGSRRGAGSKGSPVETMS